MNSDVLALLFGNCYKAITEATVLPTLLKSNWLPMSNSNNMFHHAPEIT
jgi:hypothetical protein